MGTQSAQRFQIRARATSAAKVSSAGKGANDDDTGRDVGTFSSGAHVDLTEWIIKNQPQAKQIMNQQLQKETGKALAPQVLDDAFSRMQVTYDPIRSSLFKSTQQAFNEGFLGRAQPDLSNLYDLSLLNEVLREKKASPVQ